MPERLNKLAEFLADLTTPTINISQPRRLPSTGDVFVVNILLNAVKGEVGKKDQLRIKQIIKNNFTLTPLLEEQIDQIWNLYDSDEAFFAHLETCLSTYEKR